MPGAAKFQADYEFKDGDKIYVCPGIAGDPPECYCTMYDEQENLNPPCKNMNCYPSVAMYHDYVSPPPPKFPMTFGTLEELRDWLRPSSNGPKVKVLSGASKALDAKVGLTDQFFKLPPYNYPMLKSRGSETVGAIGAINRIVAESDGSPLTARNLTIRAADGITEAPEAWDMMAAAESARLPKISVIFYNRFCKLTEEKRTKAQP